MKQRRTEIGLDLGFTLKPEGTGERKICLALLSFLHVCSNEVGFKMSYQGNYAHPSSVKEGNLNPDCVSYHNIEDNLDISFLEIM